MATPVVDPSLFEDGIIPPGFEERVQAVLAKFGKAEPRPKPPSLSPDTREWYDRTIGKSPTPEGEGPYYPL